MPDWLYSKLERGPKVTTINTIGRDGRLLQKQKVENETPGLVPLLATLCPLDPSVEAVYLCHPSTVHIGKQTSKEGGFCGYRNIQMMMSYIRGACARVIFQAFDADSFPFRPFLTAIPNI